MIGMLRMTYLTRQIIILIITAVAPSCNNNEDQIKADNWEILYEQDKNSSRVIKKAAGNPFQYQKHSTSPTPKLGTSGMYGLKAVLK